MPQTAASQSSRPSRISGIANLLCEKRVLDRRTAEDIEKAAGESGLSFYRAALLNDKVDSRLLYHTASEIYGIPFFDLQAFDKKNLPDTGIPVELLRTHRIAPIYERASHLFIAVSDPSDIAAVEAVRFHTNSAIKPVLVEADSIEPILEEISPVLENPLLTLDEDAFDDLDIVSEEEQSMLQRETDLDVDTPVVRFVNKILLDAINRGASDIHVEPYADKLRIRFRIDGVLHEVPSPPPRLTNHITSRIKILSRLDIAEKRVPQDGRMKLKLSSTNQIDFRISTLPTLFGEKIVARILDTGGIALDLHALGFETDQLAAYERSIGRPYGMILVTGPTGSGKSISLYSALNRLNDTVRNICSVEDPVEVFVSGINQVNINEKAEVDFSVALRAFLRQDPDVIMVGEIRDRETADISVKASQTGHLVLSTLHTNDALGAVTRLLNMGVESFNLGSAVNLIMAQRLVRKLCDACKRPINVPKEALLEAGFSAEQTEDAEILGPVGCAACTDGYKGRTGIFQVLEISEEMSYLIMRGERQDVLERQAIEEGVKNLRQSGIVKTLKGITSLAEVERVTNV